MEGASATLSAQAHGAAKAALDAWNALFEVLIAKYRDGYKVSQYLMIQRKERGFVGGICMYGTRRVLRCHPPGD